MAGETLKMRTTCLEQLLGKWPNKEGTMVSWPDHIWNETIFNAIWLNVMMNSLGKR